RALTQVVVPAAQPAVARPAGTLSPPPAQTARPAALMPTDLPKIRFNYDKFHGLDHSWWSCVLSGGDWRRHLRYWWDYWFTDFWWPRHGPPRLWCVVGVHDFRAGWKGWDRDAEGNPLVGSLKRPPDFEDCSRCHLRRR